jgi:hypothetical protein
MDNLKSTSSQSGLLRSGLASNSPFQLWASVEPATITDIERCPICEVFLSGAYYLINGQMACAVCAIQARVRERTHVVLIRGLLLGFGGALACLVWPYLQRQSFLREALGSIVVFLGLRIMWQLSAGARLKLDGPYDSTIKE